MVSDTIAHDINNLLMIVTGCCERLVRQETLTPAQAAELERIALATTHAAALTARLVTVSHLGAAGPRSADLADALRQGARLLEHALGDRIRIEMHLSPRTTWVPMSDAEVTQVLINLALNARDAMPDGGVLTISTTVVTLDEAGTATHRLPAGEYVDLEVRDNGAGMDTETRARAFDRFFSTKPPGRGSGLGLASVKRVVQDSGGAIDFYSTSGEGTRFNLLLPLVEEPPDRRSAAPDESMLRARPGETVLVAEDEPVVRDIVASTLRALGYETLEVATAEEALVAATARRVDLVVADVDLPGVNGVELARRLTAGSPAIKVLFMSGYGDDDSVSSTMIADPGFMQKPFTGRALSEKVRHILDRATSTSSAGPR